ncbi:MAG: DNA mismatch repair protein MutS [Chlamydiae bacterium RIFCSPHIGHO2_02_FULL_45_9]|nr:MAG: DNA mismatch repair protein MutS [Chlamydiae bacterium RIFCSPHIGHO2_02_FULL_45_9]
MSTPMMAQWQECKKEAKDALLFFRLGDFYEAFYEDAEIISKAIGITLTARQGIPMCGVPFHTAESYIDKLLLNGFKIAIAEQIEDPKETKGIVKRALVRVLTPATIINSQLINDKKNNFFVSIVLEESHFGLAILDITTAEFRVMEIDKMQHVMDELCRLKPKELLISKDFEFLKELSHYFPFVATLRSPLSLQMAQEVLNGHFDANDKEKKAGTIAAGSLLFYLQEELLLNLEHLQKVDTESEAEWMALDRSTMKNLEIQESLIQLLDETSTPMGGRLLCHFVQYPLLSPEKIFERQEQIACFIRQQDLAKTLMKLLSQIKDIERLIMKIAGKYAGPRDLYALGRSLTQIPEVKKLLPQERLGHFDDLSKRILSAMNDSPPLKAHEGEVFRDGYHQELDSLRKLAKDSMSWMAQYQLHLREETGIKTLKVGYTRAFGYYIEVPRAQSGRIPDTFHRRQTLVNAERFLTQELKDFEHRVLTAEERSKAIELELCEHLRKEIAKESGPIHQAAKTIAKIDVMLALTTIAVRNQWTRPIVDHSDTLEIIGGRHPVIESHVGRASFIANDTHLSPKQQLLLITGPNMAGKSTYIRQVALIAILAQMGSYVPATSTRMGIIDKIFSRIGASDDIARGQSTFMVEMSETANILNNATSRSLVLLDEIGRGTSTYDGISIAWAVAEYLLTTHRKQAKTLFATHYWELTRLKNHFPNAANVQTAVKEIDSGIVFLRKIIPGGTDKSYGIHVAKLAGLPNQAIQRAEEMLKELERGFVHSVDKEEQMSFLLSAAKEHPVLNRLKKIDLLHLTPIQAQHLLCELKNMI